MTTARYPEDLASIGAAREFVSQALAHMSADLVERALLMTSELATNAVRHAHSAFTVTTRTSAEEIYVSVTDTRGGIPQPRQSDPTQDSGRGLMIVNALADRWGTDIERHGTTTVWFSLRLAPQYA